jgi:hypothetical protein
MPIIYTIIAVILIALIYGAIHKKVSKTFEYKDTDIDTDLKEFRESHAVAKVINRGSLNLKESTVQRYERMCVLEPLKYKGDTSIPSLIAEYQAIITGKVLDPQGLNIPSEILLGKPNPDYAQYVTNQAKALKQASYSKPSKALEEEQWRVVRLKEEQTVRSTFIAELVSQGIPAFTAEAAASDAKLNSYTAEDWKKFCKIIPDYVTLSDSLTVMLFVKLFDDKKILFDFHKFEQYLVYVSYNIPDKIIIELLKGRISQEQSARVVTLVQDHRYEWDEALQEVLQEDQKKSQENKLRKSYGWNGI